MNKKRKLFRIAFLLLVLCMVSTVMISGTFAKYTSEYLGQDTALIAKWDLEIKGGQLLAETALGDPVETLNLFEHTDYTNMVNADGSHIIAPGVDGNFNLDFTNNSDVAAAITFEITKTENTPFSIPIVFSFDSDFSTSYTTVEQLTNALNDLNIALDQTNGHESKRVYWKWAFERVNGDEDDTANGIASAGGGGRKTYILDVKVTATQVAPGTADFNMAAISGTAKVGQILTAGALNPVGASVDYQWQISGTLDGTYTDIAEDADGNTYTPIDGQQNKYIRVKATGTGANSGVLTSAAVGPITNP